ncbi:MAG: hypothetical protein R3C52_15585 [Hyphomonadaceae bacterium]
MKHLLAALGLGLAVGSVTILTGQADAEALKVKPILKDLKKSCLSELKQSGYKKSGSKFCTCATNVMETYLTEVDGVEQQTRLWAVRRNLLPDSVTDEEIYARAAEAGVEKNALTTELIVEGLMVDEHYNDCAAHLDLR